MDGGSIGIIKDGIYQECSEKVCDRLTNQGKIELYFHGAMEGTKYDLIEKDNRASFEMDCEHKLVTEVERGSCTMEYESVIGQGRVEMLSDDEKYNALYIFKK